jgi:nucleotide-binding universal stress UspA family protein
MKELSLPEEQRNGMCSWRKICCPVDFSHASRVAVEHAAGLAQHAKGELLLVHVKRRLRPIIRAMFAPPVWHTPSVSAGESQLESWTHDAQHLAAGLATSVELAGDPATEVIRFAAEFDCDLIVMGARGGARGRRATFSSLGSVAQRIAGAAHCPVLVVRGQEM